MESPTSCEEGGDGEEYEESYEEQVSALRYALNKRFNEMQAAMQRYSKVNSDQNRNEAEVATQKYKMLKKDLLDLKKDLLDLKKVV